MITSHVLWAMTVEDVLRDGCPRCGAKVIDLRGAGFSAAKLESQEICYIWGKETLTCNGDRRP